MKTQLNNDKKHNVTLLSITFTGEIYEFVNYRMWSDAPSSGLV